MEVKKKLLYVYIRHAHLLITVAQQRVTVTRHTTADRWMDGQTARQTDCYTVIHAGHDSDIEKQWINDNLTAQQNVHCGPQTRAT